MKKQQIAGVVLAAVLVLGGAAFAGYQSTRYPRTLKAANQAVQAGQEAEAVALYEKAVNVSPKKAEAYLALADIYEKHAQHADAVSVLKKAAESIPGKSGEAAKIQEKLEELNPTVTASQESGTYQDPVELKLESKSGKEIRYELSEAPDSTDSAPQSYTEPLTFRRNGTYRIKCYAMNQSGEAGDPTELNFTIQLDPEKYHMNSWYQGKDGGWYYNNDAGEPVIGWRLIDNNWYYFADNGRMKTGWMQLDGKYYYLDDNGVIANGWRQFDGRYYYFLSDGSMAANQWVDGAYYVGADGVMLVSTTTPDGKKVGADGKKVDERWKEVMISRVSQLTFRNELKPEEDEEYYTRFNGLTDLNQDGVPEISVSVPFGGRAAEYYDGAKMIIHDGEDMLKGEVYYPKGFISYGGGENAGDEAIVRYDGSNFKVVASGSWDRYDDTRNIEINGKTVTFADWDSFNQKLVELVGGGEPIEPKMMYPNASRSELIQIIRNW